MATTNLSTRFFSFRNEVESDHHYQPLNADVVIDINSLAQTNNPDWILKTKQVDTTIEEAKNIFQNLKLAQSKRTENLFNDALNNDLESNVSTLTNNLIGKFKEIKDLNSSFAPKTKADAAIVKNFINSRSENIRKMLLDFHKSKTQYDNFVSKNRSSLYSNPADDPSSESNNNGDKYAYEYANEKKEKVDLERTQKIIEINGEISMMLDMFKDLNSMAIKQGDILTEFEDNIIRTDIHVEKGTVQLVEAEKKSSGAWSCKCLIILAIILVLLLVVMIFRYS
jgi:hypothetical protein